MMLAAEFYEPLTYQIFSPVAVFGFGISFIPPENSMNKTVSFFALFILHGIEHLKGCKNETK